MNNSLSTFESLAGQFENKFQQGDFPKKPKTLYDAAGHLLTVRGKRIRPVLCLMATELFIPITDDAFHAAAAIELFHNFTLVHDDIMDDAPLRRGKPTVHTKYGDSTALLAGDVMLVRAYEYINSVDKIFLSRVLELFNATATQVCEGQQLDMEFEKIDEVSMEDYVNMISRKTSVLLAASLQMGGLLGGASRGNQELLYEFGKNLGIAFQVQDDYLDAFGDPEKTGKIRGGDILANKKTFLLLRALHTQDEKKRSQLKQWMEVDGDAKIEPILELYKSCGIDDWAREFKQQYFQKALSALEDVAVLSSRKSRLQQLADALMQREQ